MDNKRFNVNGVCKDRLYKALELVMMKRKVKAWDIDDEKGFIIYWNATKNNNKFPVKLDVNEITDIVWKWLESEEGQEFEADGDIDHDGHNKRGWLVYVDAWSKVADHDYSIVAIKPEYLWYGK